MRRILGRGITRVSFLAIRTTIGQVVVATSSTRCPKCQSQDVHRSHRRWWERVLSSVYPRSRPRRCCSCQHRFWPPKPWASKAVSQLRRSQNHENAPRSGSESRVICSLRPTAGPGIHDEKRTRKPATHSADRQRSSFSLVLTYLPLNPAWSAVQGIPALVVLPENAPVPQPARDGPPAVVYLPISAGPSVLLDKITGLIGSEAEPK